jgi:hypothetical protein
MSRDRRDDVGLAPQLVTITVRARTERGCICNRLGVDARPEWAESKCFTHTLNPRFQSYRQRGKDHNHNPSIVGSSFNKTIGPFGSSSRAENCIHRPYRRVTSSEWGRTPGSYICAHTYRRSSSESTQAMRSLRSHENLPGNCFATAVASVSAMT